MKREILFRGKLVHSNEWVEGNLIIARNGQPYIIPFKIFEPDGHHLIIDSDSAFWVKPETVGQLTGLTDKNGKKIFEGDVDRYGRIVEFSEGSFWIGGILSNFIVNHSNTFEVVGNIFDNPDLVQ